MRRTGRTVGSPPEHDRNAGCPVFGEPIGEHGRQRGGPLERRPEGDDARAADALALAEEIRERVKQEHGIDLEYEVELWSSKGEDQE